MQFRRDIQGLRAIAVLAVIVFHLNPGSLPMFDEVPVWNNQVTYYDEHHLNEVGIFECAKEATPIIQKAIFND